VNYKEYIKCPKCKTLYQIPKTDQLLRITCKVCNQIFYNKHISFHRKKKTKFIFIGIALIIIITLSWFFLNPKSEDSIIKTIRSNNWVTISYSNLVNPSVLTHSGETVGEVIKNIPSFTDDYKGYVQPYLEPFSELCYDVLLATEKTDSIPLTNIIDHYPVGSEQPAWVALFREGHYVLYYNQHVIRVFINGSDPEISYESHYSVIRHPINDVLASNSVNIKKIAIYAFTNDYSSCEIKLNTIPYEILTEDILSLRRNVYLSPKRKEINLVGLKHFFENNIILEAVEVDGNNELYLYGRKVHEKQTLSDKQISISDLAVIYRSIFHYGYNSPYISLDENEDNRYAKVNFGGHLENTYAGDVVLEADKLFKTLGTGLNPNSHKLIKTSITKKVPNFLTEDERNLLDNFGEEHMQIRYWFYPDSILTVTDGSIGAVQRYQFLADIERMDANINASNAVRKTINHLNRNYSQYEKALYTYRELSSVGRIMALVNWLKHMDTDRKVELDDLLSVMIPAFKTPNETKKMFAITAIAYSDKSKLTNRYVRDNSKVYDISNLLDDYDSSTSDDKFLSIAENYYDNIDISEIAPPIYNKILSESKYYNQLIKSIKNEITGLDAKIKFNESRVDNYNAESVNQFNKLVIEYNKLLKKQETYVNSYNNKINKLNELNITTHSIASIGGGIDLKPSNFKIISNKSNYKIQQIHNIKNRLVLNKSTSSYKNWIRSNSGSHGSTINELPIIAHQNLESKNSNRKFYYNSSNKRFEFYN
jgi:hypothetical protein